MGPAREGRKIVLSGDTAPCEALAIAAHQADVLVHEATFAEEEAERARQTVHSTARQAARARARRARCGCSRSRTSRAAMPGGELRDEARAVFAATEAPRDFDTIEVPFPERGARAAGALVERRARAGEPLRRIGSLGAARCRRSRTASLALIHSVAP